MFEGIQGSLRDFKDWYQKERPGDITGEITAHLKQDTLTFGDSSAKGQPPRTAALG